VVPRDGGARWSNEGELDSPELRTERKETGMSRVLPRREGSYMADRPRGPGRAELGMGPRVALGKTEELRPARNEGE